MADIRFPLPDVGEGLTEGEMVQWRVAVGDRIVLDQVFVEIETAKSLVELPSAYVGTVTEILVAEGTTVSVGTPILVIQTDVAVEAPPPATGGEPPAPSHHPAPPPLPHPPPPPLTTPPPRAPPPPPARGAGGPARTPRGTRVRAAACARCSPSPGAFASGCGEAAHPAARKGPRCLPYPGGGDRPDW